MSDLKSQLCETTRFRRLQHVAECESTQALSQADAGEDWAIFWAEHQTAGRGRQGRVWHDAAGQDLALTFRLTGLELESPTHLAAGIPVAVVRGIDHLAPEVRIKWPNDLLLHGSKLCGILIDSDGAQESTPQTYHVGVGLNVNRGTFPKDLEGQSTSLALATGREFERETLVLGLAQAITAVVSQLATESGREALTTEFRQRLGLVGQAVRAEVGNRVVEGALEHLDLREAVVAGQRIPLAHLRSLKILPQE